MSGKIRKKHSDAFKLKVALAALRGNKTMVELCQEFGVSANQIYYWKKKLEDEGASIFADKRQVENRKEELDKLHKVIGQLVLERDFLVDVLDRSK
jgi:transposase-like protein